MPLRGRRGAPARAVGAIVTDAGLRNSVAGIRGLGRDGVRVVALGPRRGAAGLWSRHAAGRAVAAGNGAGDAGLIAAIERVTLTGGRFVVYPGDEATIDALIAGPLPAGAELPYARPEALDRLRDKRELTRRAADCGLSAPATLAEGTAAELSRAPVRTPCVIKRIRPGGALPAAQLITSAERLRSLLRALPGDEPLMVQERARGQLCALAMVIDAEGRLRARFQQIARRTWPREAGVSSLAVSVACNRKLVERAAHLLRQARFAGLAQLQFLWGDEDPLLIDVNPRFYGSLPLALACGVNLPAIWHAAATGEPSRDPGEYRVGVSYRWLAGELKAAALGASSVSLGRAAAPRAGAVWSADDPVPSLILAAGAVGDVIGRLARGRDRPLRRPR